MRLGEKCTPLVTALICNYNYGDYIREAIESVLNQTWKKLEIIVVDDGSTDASREILANYQDKIITIFKNNGGQASAFNVGVAAASGDIICFLDSDDCWHPDKVSAIVQKYKDGDYGLICHDLELLNNKSEALGDTWSNFAHVELTQGDAIDVLVKNNYRGIFSPTTGMSLPINIATHIFPLPEDEWKLCADRPIAQMAACLAPVGVTNEMLGYYRIHGKNGFALFHDDAITNRVAGVIHIALSYFFTKSYVNKDSRHRVSSPKSNYIYYRRCCLVARSKPWSYLIPLYKRNIIYHSRLGDSNYLMTSLSIVKYAFLDTFVASCLLLRIPIKYQKYRSCFTNEAEKLDEHVLHYILHDDDGDRL